MNRNYTEKCISRHKHEPMM